MVALFVPAVHSLRISLPTKFNTPLVCGMKRQRGEHEGSTSTAGAQLLFEINVANWNRQPNSGAPGIHITEPFEVGCYSRDGERRVEYGSRLQLSKYQDPPLGADLSDNIDTFREKVQDDFGVEPVVRALQSCKFNVRKDSDFVTYRNNLNKIAGTPYNGRDAWELDAVKLPDSPVFLDVRKLDEGTPSPMHKRFMYMGYYFESLCTGTQDEPVDANSEFCSIIRLRLGGHRILFAAEIDCEWDQSPTSGGPLRNYIELKTMREPRSRRDRDNMHRHRFMKYWIQSFLAGVRTVVVGVRDDDGFLRKIEHFPTRELPHRARAQLAPARNQRYQSQGGGGTTWEPFVILNFLDHVLYQIRTHCKANVGKAVRVRYDPRQKKVEAWILTESAFSNRMTEALL